jgi:hypothetical protein
LCPLYKQTSLAAKAHRLSEALSEEERAVVRRFMEAATAVYAQ